MQETLIMVRSFGGRWRDGLGDDLQVGAEPPVMTVGRFSRNSSTSSTRSFRRSPKPGAATLTGTGARLASWRSSGRGPVMVGGAGFDWGRSPLPVSTGLGCTIGLWRLDVLGTVSHVRRRRCSLGGLGWARRVALSPSSRMR